MQAVLSRGDAALAKVLADIEEISLSGWRKAVEKHGIDADFYAHRKWDIGQKLPWDIIDSGAEAGYLEKELEKALA